MLKVGIDRETRRAVICTAIKQMRTMEFYYHGGYRTVEPFALGIVLQGDADNESLICWQTGGFSDLREVVGWKLYRESEMEDMEVRTEKFTGERPGYDPDNIGMWQVICCVRPVKKAEEVVEPPPPPPPVEKLTIESPPAPFYEPAPMPPPSPPPEVKRPPIVRYFTHNELMERFRFAHPMPIPELYTTLWPQPLAMPFPEHPASKILPATIIAGINRYLVGDMA
jgi:hypothetical protein